MGRKKVRGSGKGEEEGTSQKKSLQVAEVEIAGGAFFRPPQCDKGFFR